jgi:hypothetical protein
VLAALVAGSPSSPAFFLGCLGMDVHLTWSYFIVAHLHFVRVGPSSWPI